MENNNASAQQPTQPQQPAPLVQPKEPGFCEEAWEAAKVVAGVSATKFVVGFAEAAGIVTATCLVLKLFGVLDNKSNS